MTHHVLVLGGCRECRLVVHPDFEDGPDCGNTWHSPEWEIECPGVEVGGCMTYFSCTVCPPEVVRDFEGLDDSDPVAHGVEHVYLSSIGGWSVPVGRCFLQEDSGTGDCIADECDWKTDTGRQVPAGRYYIEYEIDEDTVEWIKILGEAP